MKYFLILAILSILFTSCGDNSNGNSISCTPACEEWQTCNDGTCELISDRCESTDNCKENAEKPICDLTKHICVAEIAPECIVNDDCKNQAKPICKDNVCVADSTPECTVNDDCKDQTKPICKDNVCVADNTPECTVNDDCKNQAKPICKDNICVADNTDNCIGLSYSDIQRSSQDENHYVDLVIDGNYYLSIEFYEDSPAASYDLASVGVNDNYETCKQCVLIYKIADDDETVEKIFFQSQGNMNITEGLAGTGESKGEITNIKLIESTIDEDNNFHSSTVENGNCIEIQTGETWAWDTMPTVTCTDNELRCNLDGTKIEKCLNNEWIEDITCESYKECKTIENTPSCELKNNACIPNTESCEENNIAICNEQGTEKTIVEACTLPQVCNEDNGTFSCLSNNKTILEIRNLEVNLNDGEDGAIYTTTGIVTAVTEHGYYMQDATEAGIYVFLGYSETPTEGIGDEITITATARNYQGLLELANPLLRQTLGTTVTPNFTDIDVLNIENLEAQESMLVNMLNPPFVVISIDDHNNTLLKDSNDNEFVMRNSLFDYDTPLIGLKYSKLQGVLTYEYDIYKLLPIMTSDIEIVPDTENCTINGTECDENLTKTVCNQTTLKCVVPVEIDNCSNDNTICQNNTNGKTTCIENICTEVLNKTILDIRTLEKDLENNIESANYYKTTGVITAIKTNGFYIQDSTGAVYTYMHNTEFTQEVGNKVEIIAKVKNYRGLLEFINPIITDNGVDILPNFTDIDALNIENVEIIENNESMLVNFLNPPFIVIAIDSNHNITLKDANDNHFKMKSSIYSFTTEINTVYSSLKGILNYEYNEYRLLPREASDIQERVEIEDCTINGNECSVNIINTVCNETALKCIQPIEINDCTQNSNCENNTNGKTVCITNLCSDPIEIDDCTNDLTACDNNTNGKTVCINNICSETVDCTINGNECDNNLINIICNETTLQCEALPAQPLNGDFENWIDETNAENWTYNETGFSLQKEITNIHTGSFSAKISRLLEAYTDNEKAQMDSNFIPIQENKTYKISAYFLDNTDNVRGRISYAWFDTNNNRIGIPSYSNFTIDDADWQELIFNTENAPENAVNLKIFIRVYKQNADTGSIYLDDVTITEK